MLLRKDVGQGRKQGPISRRRAGILACLVMATSFVALDSSPASAAALTTVAWSVSNNQVSATPVVYAYSFTTGSSGNIKTITMVVSGAGLAGTPAVSKAYGVPAGTVGRTGQTITYTVTSNVLIQTGIGVYLEFTGLTNTATTGSYTTSITTLTNASAIIDGPTTSTAVTMAPTNTAAAVTVSKSLTFTLDTTSFQLAMDPSLPALADQTKAIGITVLTNANSGYTLSVSDVATGMQSSSTGNPVIADVSTGKATSVVWPGPSKFGYAVTGTGATIDAAFNGSKYAGYTPGGETIASRTSPTGGTADTITITNRVAIDYGAPTGDYADTITYTVTPNYS